MAVKTLEDCQSNKCKVYRGMEGTFVRCGRIKQFTVMVPSMPSNDNKGFKNGVVVVNCGIED